MNPRDLGVPHDAWRPGQYEAIEDALGDWRDGRHVSIMEAPTGTGKSGVARGVGGAQPVAWVQGRRAPRLTVAVTTLALVDQYATGYGLTAVKGRQEYPCPFAEREGRRDKTAADCLFSPMKKCPLHDECPYALAKERARTADASVCTLPYLVLSRPMRTRPGVLVLDEAHLLPSQLMRLLETRLSSRRLERLDVPLAATGPAFRWSDQFPGVLGEGGILSSEDGHRLLGLVGRVGNELEARLRTAEGNQAGSGKPDPMIATLKGLAYTYWGLEDGLTRSVAGDWWVAVEADERGGDVLALRSFRPELAVARLFTPGRNVLLMSATIGDPAILAEQLGVTNYGWHARGHPVPTSKRPVVTGLLVPSMNRRAMDDPVMVGRWVKAVAGVCRGHPQDRILVLTNTNRRVELLREALTREFDGRVVGVAPGLGPDARVAVFKDAPGPNRIHVDTIQGLGVGTDFYGDTARVVVVAGVPYQSLGDRFTAEWARRYQDRYAADAALSVVQAAGRVSRAERAKGGGYEINYAYIADRLALSDRLQRFYPAWFKQAMVPATEPSPSRREA